MEKLTPDRLIRTRRRTVSLEISRDAKLIVRAPNNVPMHFIEGFISKKQRWIEKKLAIALKRAAENAPRIFTEGQRFPYLGTEYPLSIIEGQDRPLSFNSGFFLSRSHIQQAKEIFINWYRKEAVSIIEERLKKYSHLTGLKHNRINISNAKRRWGSCTAANNLSFNWRLIMAPISVIDYVITHELAHLEEKNHSRQFWAKVSSIFPLFNKSKTWLRENGHKLTI